MAEYIKREAARELMYQKQAPLTEYDLDSIPVVDVEEVVYGSWIYVNGNCGCSVCRQCLSYDGNGVILDLSRLPYCPHCGAKMG